MDRIEPDEIEDDRAEEGAPRNAGDTDSPATPAAEANGDEALAQARRECDALFERLVARAAAAEQEQERRAQAWSHKGRRPRHGLGWRWCDPPLPLRAGLRTALGRAVRHWDNPDARILVTARLAEAALLPFLSARDADDRDRVNVFIAAALRIDGAVAAGRLQSFVVCWKQTGRWPRRPLSVRLLWPGGRAQGERLLGEHSPLLARLVDELRRPVWKHYENGRLMEFPPALGLPPRR